jgi:monooxygenase
MTAETIMPEHFDVIMVGAGLSGVNAAYHLVTSCRAKSFVILESRDAMGGTWDLFRYPGIRSDSDMFTFGYPFRPWVSANAIGDGESIRSLLDGSTGASAAKSGTPRAASCGGSRRGH